MLFFFSISLIYDVRDMLSLLVAYIMVGTYVKYPNIKAPNIDTNCSSSVNFETGVKLPGRKLC